MADYSGVIAEIKSILARLEDMTEKVKIEIENHDSYVNNFPVEEQKIVDELIEKKAQDVNIAIPKIIQNWYDSYSPIFYKERRGDLKEAYISKSNKTENNITLITAWGIDSGKMPAGSNGLSPMMMDYLAFKKGYHGGANPKGVYYAAPRYRKPYPHYTYWGRPAIKTDPIDNDIEAWFKAYDKKLQAEYDRRVGLLKEEYGVL